MALPANQQSKSLASIDPAFRFVDLFAGIGGIRAGLESAGGRSSFSVELDKYARRTYEANWGEVSARDVRCVQPGDLPEHEVMAAGFPCQPFSLAGVSRKTFLKRAHGFDDVTSGNLFFHILRLIGGPWDEPVSVEEAEASDDWDDKFQASAPESETAPPVLLLENVRHLLSHDQKRTFRVIRRRLMASGYLVSYQVINGAIWVPQNRRRVVIVALRRDLFDAPFVFPSPGDEYKGPRLDERILEPDGTDLERYRLTPGVWRALQNHRARHEGKGTGFGYGIAQRGGITRTLSARYYKDGAEILIPMPDGGLPRRLTPLECARLMGFSEEHLGFKFGIPVSDAQAYRQFGNSVVVPQFKWVGKQILERARAVFTERLKEANIK